MAWCLKHNATQVVICTNHVLKFCQTCNTVQDTESNITYSIGPNDALFKRFRVWYLAESNNARLNNTVFPDPTSFVTWEWNETSSTGLYKNSLNCLTWAKQRLTDGTFPREDYRELCELLNSVLGGEVNEQY